MHIVEPSFGTKLQNLGEYPYPIAHTYSAFLGTAEPRLRCERLVFTFSLALRYCAAIAIGEYLRGPDRVPRVDRSLSFNLGRPSLGHWNKFLNEILRHLAEKGTRLFAPELLSAYRTPRGRSTEAAAAADALISFRNDYLKTGAIANLSADKVAELLRKREIILHTFLTSIGFLRDYPLLHVDKHIALPGNHACRWKARTLMGADPGAFQMVTLDQREPPRSTSSLYLLNPISGETLCLSPFLIWQASDDQAIPRKPEIFFFEGRKRRKLKYVGMRTPTLLNDEFRAEVDSLIESLRKPAPTRTNLFESYLANVHPRLEEQLQAMKYEKFRPHLYVDRREIQAEIDHFLKGDKTGLIITGEAGMGKTNLLCNLCERQSAEGNLVLLYDAGGSLTLDIEKQIAMDLLGAETGDFWSSFETAIEAVVRNNRKLVILLDALNEFYFGQFRAADLLKAIDGFISRCPSSGVKVIITCRTGTWNQLEVLRRTELQWHRYHTIGHAHTLALGGFTDDELPLAYRKYQAWTSLHTDFEQLSKQARERCRAPLLLRLTAIAYEGRPVPRDVLTIRVLQDYYDTRVGRRMEDVQLLDALVGKMHQRRTDSLPLLELHSDPVLRTGTTDDPSSPYQRLKDKGILMEVAAVPLPQVKFTYDRFFEYILALHHLRRTPETSLSNALAEMATASWEYPLLWGTALTILSIKTDRQLFLDLAQSNDYSVRELAVDALVALHHEDPSMAIELASLLLELEQHNAARVALKAAYQIGKPGQAVFLKAVDSGTDTIRKLLVDYLYLLWQRDRDASYAFLERLISRVGVHDIGRISNLLEVSTGFVLNVSLNHIHERQAVEGFTGAIRMLFRDKFRLPAKPKTRYVAAFLAGAGLRVVGLLGNKLFGPRVAEAMLWGTFLPPEKVIKACQSEPIKTHICRILDTMMEPDSDWSKVEEPLVNLLQSEWLFPNTVGSLAVATHYIRQPDTFGALIPTLFDRLPAPGRLWLIMAFTLTLPYGLSADRINLLEDLTERFVRENRGVFFEDPWGLYQNFEIPLLPLGLAYCQENIVDLPLYRGLLESAMETGDVELFDRMIRGLSSVGHFYPEAVLDFVASFENLGVLDHPSEALRILLASIGAVHPGAVDRFCLRVGYDETARRAIRVRAEPELARRYIEWVANYNLCAYMLTHPDMINPEFLRWMLDDVIRGVTTCSGPDALTRAITQRWLVQMQDNEYNLAKVMYGPN